MNKQEFVSNRFPTFDDKWSDEVKLKWFGVFCSLAGDWDDGDDEVYEVGPYGELLVVAQKLAAACRIGYLDDSADGPEMIRLQAADPGIGPRTQQAMKRKANMEAEALAAWDELNTEP